MPFGLMLLACSNNWSNKYSWVWTLSLGQLLLQPIFDDILAFSNTLEDHLKHLHLVLECFKEANLITSLNNLSIKICPLDQFFNQQSWYSVGIRWQLHPIAYAGQSLSPPEKNYSVTELETFSGSSSGHIQWTLLPHLVTQWYLGEDVCRCRELLQELPTMCHSLWMRPMKLTSITSYTCAMSIPNKRGGYWWIFWPPSKETNM